MRGKGQARGEGEEQGEGTWEEVRDCSRATNHGTLCDLGISEGRDTRGEVGLDGLDDVSIRHVEELIGVVLYEHVNQNREKKRVECKKERVNIGGCNWESLPYPKETQ